MRGVALCFWKPAQRGERRQPNLTVGTGAGSAFNRLFVGMLATGRSLNDNAALQQIPLTTVPKAL
ncbi:hypothetical protein NOVOSPHI9U_560008 [Novosphingobium sp. 9U]|nr:hypothetical protein NOVOSPHI9U_560008 [Novosphingobium sp. 9U]